jgi:hypothetical protein
MPRREQFVAWFGIGIVALLLWESSLRPRLARPSYIHAERAVIHLDDRSGYSFETTIAPEAIAALQRGEAELKIIVENKRQ